MAKIENGKVKIGGHEIVVKDVLSWMKSLGRYCTSVEMRDKFDWKLRQTGRVLMRLLEKGGKVIIAPHPTRKNSYCYGLKGMPKPTKETFAKPKPEKKKTSKTEKVTEKADDLVVAEGGEIKEKKPEKPKPTNDPAHQKIDDTVTSLETAGKELTNEVPSPPNPWQGK